MTLIESNQNDNFSQAYNYKKMKGTSFRSHLIQRLHFRDEEIEAQIDNMFWPRIHSWLEASQD